MFKRLLLISVLCSPVAAWALFKPVRIVEPEVAGIVCFVGEVCVDDASRYREAVGLYDEALKFVDVTVGTIEKRPRVIFCSFAACSQYFDVGQRAAMTVATFGIVVSPRGWKSYYVRHEMIHHLQNEQMGMLSVWVAPKWFTEGMAYSLSDDPRPQLSEPFEQYRSQFANWYFGVGKERLWKEARDL